MESDIFAEVEKAAVNPKPVVRASWRGVLTLDTPEIGFGSVQYHLRAAKVHGDQKKVEYIKRAERLPSSASSEGLLNFKLVANWTTNSVPLIGPKSDTVLRTNFYSY